MSDVFITDDFLLQSPQAVELYHQFAKGLPIIDYHCHLPPEQVARDHRFENLTQIWLYGDHYKWRAMRAAGINERCITGDATDWEKMVAWAETVPQTLRNPLYHWTHLELKRPFGISDRLFNPQTVDGIYRECNEKLKSEEFSCRGIMRQMKVALVCTTDDPIDDLAHHRAIAADKSFPIQVLPTFRPDKAHAVRVPSAFNAWVERLAERSGVEVGDRFERYLEALRKRHDFFHNAGCRLSDHGLETFYAEDGTAAEIAADFRKLRSGHALDALEAARFQAALLHELALMDHARGWTQQFHIGPLRNNNSRQLAALGPDTGFDSIGDLPVAAAMSRFLDRLDRDNRLPRTILYNINPADNEVYATMIGNFQDGSSAGKMQYGSGWWFLDQQDGMQRQLNALSNQGLLSRFVGMLTDSRSFLSYTRHEYFRRILCNVLGTEMRQGLLPNDMTLVGQLVSDVCYGNAARYFGFELPALSAL